MSKHATHQELSAYIDRETSEPVRRRISGHLRECPVCCGRMEQMERLHDAFVRLPRPEPDPEMFRKVSRRLGITVPARIRWSEMLSKRIFFNRWAWVGVCAVAVVLGSVAFLPQLIQRADQAAPEISLKGPEPASTGQLQKNKVRPRLAQEGKTDPVSPIKEAEIAAVLAIEEDSSSPAVSVVPGAQPFQHAEFAGSGPSAGSQGSAPSGGARVASGQLQELTPPSVKATPVPTPPSADSVEVRQNLFDPARGESVELITTIAAFSHMRIAVYNRQGELIKVLVDGSRSPGSYSDRWNGRNDSGSVVSTGYYVIHVQTDALSVRKPVAVVK
jgi:anti-sigma factor RsiW